MKRTMRRRGSHSASMLKPAIAVVQGHQQQQQDQADDGAVRRTSAPSFVGQGSTNGGLGAMQAPPPHAPAWQANGGAPAPAQTNGSSMQWQHTPSFGQSTTASTRHHSFCSSMDLMTTTAPAHAASASAVQSHLFKSSSHHTSHTAAAGDLLTMSRRALDPPSPNQSGAKKRSSAVFNGNDGNVGQFGGTNSSSPREAQQPAHNIFTHPQQQQPLPPPLVAPQNRRPMYQSVGGGAQFNGQTNPAFQTFVSSSTIGSENDDLHHQQRRIRQCRRSNSFEMMDDC